MSQHYLVVDEEYPYIEHPDDCPTEEILLGNDEVKYTVYRCECNDDDYDLEDYFETTNLVAGKYPIEYWSEHTSNYVDGEDFEDGLRLVEVTTAAKNSPDDTTQGSQNATNRPSEDSIGQEGKS